MRRLKYVLRESKKKEKKKEDFSDEKTLCR